MVSRQSSEEGEKLKKKSKSSKCWIYNCFSQTSLSDSEFDSDSDYVVVNHSVFKIPKNLQAVPDDSNLNPSSSKESRTLIVQRGSEKRTSNRRPVRKSTDARAATTTNAPPRTNASPRTNARKGQATTNRSPRKAEIDEKIYQYIRMKTYEKMNPYDLSPNDFLNNISSVFVENLKDQVPKDPLRRPKIYNRYIRKKKKSEVQVMYERAKEREQRFGSEGKSNYQKPTQVHSFRKPTINPAVMSDLDTKSGEESLGYKAAIEQEEKGKEYEEKILIWKIVVVNEDEESRE